MERTDSRRPRTLTIHQVADALNVSPRSVWSWIASGRLRAIRLGRRTTRVPEEAVEEFLSACGEGR